MMSHFFTTPKSVEITKIYREFVADSVIQATGIVEFEDGLRIIVLLGPLERPHLA